MEADVDAVVAGFIAGEGFPLPEGFLDGVEGGVKGLGIGTFVCSFLQHAAQVIDGGFGGGDAVLDAYVVETGKEFGSFRFDAVRQQERVVLRVVVSENTL